jgi:tRNA threonylcarbamoyl adenosine modification protein YeaZ
VNAASTGNFLGIDTATPYLALAVWSRAAGLLSKSVELVERRHAARLVPALEETMEAAGITKKGLAAIVVGRGPGSYTGLRVGIAAALGLARALGVPLSGCDTLAAIAYAGLEDGQEGLAALDARRGNLYVGRYLREGAHVLTVAPPRKAPREMVQAEHSRLPLIEHLAPDAGFVARQAEDPSPFSPIYL